MAEPARLRVEVVAAWPGHAFRAELALAEGATVADAIAASGIHAAQPELEVRADRIGIFARRAQFTTRLRDGDRVEVYRPLRIDPKEARRRRAERAAGG